MPYKTMNAENKTGEGPKDSSPPTIRVLLVEDDPGDAEIIQKKMTKIPQMVIRCTWVDRLEQGLSQLKNNTFDLVMLDLNLPDSQGIETLFHIRETAADAPVIVMTGLSDEKTALQAIKSGSQDYLVKGEFNSSLLFRTIAYSLERHRLLKKIEEKESFTSLLIGGSFDGILLVDERGVITFANPAACTIFGVESNELNGLPYGFPLTTHGSPLEIEINCRDGLKTVEMFSTGLKIEGRTHYLASLRDITDRKKLETALLNKNEELKKETRYKSEFLANVSHELRSPLNSIMLLSQIIAQNKKGNLTKDQVELAETIHHSGNDLLILVNDLLDLSKIESGKMTVYISETRFEDIAIYIRQTFTHLAETNGIRLEITVSEDIPEFIWTDSQKLGQILRNLISNAIKFTHEGSVTVEFKRPSPDMRTNGEALDPLKTVAISVKDTGIGIPEDKRDIIFEAFRQADGGTSRQYGGTGLGLSISKSLAELLGGSIHLASEAGKGSAFTLCIPERISEAGDVHLDRRAKERIKKESYLEKAVVGNEDPDIFLIENEVLKGRHVLIVDDDARNLFIMSQVLEEHGINTAMVMNGHKALEFLEQSHSVDFVLMDIMMPGMDGYETIRKLRNLKKHGHIPIIAVTGKAQAEDHRLCLDAGANEFITKPVDLNKLFSAMRRLVSNENGCL